MIEHWSTVRSILTVGLFGAALAAILIRPRWLGEGMAAAIAAGLIVIIGAVRPAEAWVILAGKLDVFAFFLGMMTLTVIAEEAGVFAWLAEQAVRHSGGSTRRLYLNVLGLGVIISTFLTNDATALVLTPLVYATVSRLALAPLPFMFACTFIADTASLTLPVSNPINLLLAGELHLTLGGFLRYLLLPSILAIAINIAAFLFLFRRDLRGSVPALREQRWSGQDEHKSLKGAALFRPTLVILGLVAAGFLGGGALGLPAGAVAMTGGILLLAWGMAWRLLTLDKVREGITWAIFPFIGGMFIVVRGVETTGLTAPLTALVQVMGRRPLLAAAGMTVLGAVGSNLINNVPMAAVLATAIHGSHLAAGTAGYAALAYGAIAGCDLGPNLTTVGSLSTMLWLLLLRARRLEISSLHYARLGLLVTPLMLAASALALGLLASH